MAKQPSRFPEPCVNLWWFADKETGVVLRLSGRAYALPGNDEDKLKVLRRLAKTDFHLARVFPVPSRHKFVTPMGEVLKGATTVQGISQGGIEIFEHVLKAISEDIPQQFYFTDGEPTVYRLEIPNNLLFVMTCVLEMPDGRLVPHCPSE